MWSIYTVVVDVVVVVVAVVFVVVVVVVVIIIFFIPLKPPGNLLKSSLKGPRCRPRNVQVSEKMCF